MKTLLGVLFVFSLSSTLALAPRPALAADKVRVAMLQGTQSFPLAVLKERIGKKHGLDVILEPHPGPPAVYTRMKTGDYEIAFGAWLTVSIFRARGMKIKQIYSMVDMSATGPVVPKDSPIRDYGDLKGKKIGLFGGPTATTTFTLRTMTKKFHGLDLFKESKVQFGAPPLLWGTMEKGDLDVIMTLEPFITKMLETKKFRALPTLGNRWFEKTGQKPLLVTVCAKEEWLERNEDVAKRFVRAFKESIDYVREHREIWPGIAKKLRIKTEWGQKTIYDRVAPNYITRWDRAYIQEQLKWADTVRETLGPKVRGLPKKIPDDVWSFKYAP